MKTTPYLLAAGAIGFGLWQLKKKRDAELLEARMRASIRIDPDDPRQELDEWIDSMAGDEVDVFGIG